MNWAGQVPAGFEWWLEFSANTGREEFILQTRTSGSNHSLGMHPNFLAGTFGDQDLIAGQTDPRVQHTPSWTLGHNRLTKLYKPYPGLRFDNYTGLDIATEGDDDDMELFQRDTNVLLADYVSAQHDWMEAMAAGNAQDASVLAFIDARRAVGKMGPFAGGTDDEVRAELREQRARDLFLGGFRLGDLRRWIRLGVGDFFPSGLHPTEQWGNYGDATCFPLPLEEYEGNPNLSKP
jgi:hypothetical protein